MTTKCPFCEEEGEVSRLTPDSFSTTTLMMASPGYYDEGGEWVAGYDPNIRTQGYWCSRGHRFSVTSRQGMPDEITSSVRARGNKE